MDRLLSCSLLFLSGLLYEISSGTTANRENHTETTPTALSTNQTNSSTQNITGTIPLTTSNKLVFFTKDMTSTVNTLSINPTSENIGNARDTNPTSQWVISTRGQRSTQATTSTSDTLSSKPATTAKSTASLTSLSTPLGTEEVAATSSPPGNSLVMLAFGVMSFILILIVVMVILVTTVNLRGRCSGPKEEGKKSCDSVVSESNLTTSGDKESITLVSMKTINTELDTDSPQISSINSTTPDSEHKHSARIC